MPRYRVKENFQGADGTNWTRGDLFNPSVDDDPLQLVKDGKLEDAATAEPPARADQMPRYSEHADREREAAEKTEGEKKEAPAHDTAKSGSGHAPGETETQRDTRTKR